ncbi:phage tail protein [Pseudomonas sp. S07E 245]|uniref:phage tail protein n=1 Tax=Pseudomonas sp. S07E 245 TaxID=2866278 RepID=UPI001C739D4B|nr:phage tail protein [Pseudomonas sp. S07E 245]QYX54354.1 phage tail protein [Pseudomonas sp. S07E 245]
MTGTGTNFPANSRVGDAFQGPDGRWYEVTNIASATVISILPAYLGATVAAGTYGLAPMQGYVKESADRLRQLVTQFGDTLALFGGATTVPGLLQNIGAAGRGVNGDITSLTGLTTALSIAQGGTGGTTPAAARSALQLKAAAVADVVGSVSQSGGISTGAIIERGSSANGEYVKLADGTLVTWGTRAGMTTAGSGGQITTPHPIAFASAPVTFGMLTSGGASFLLYPYDSGVSTTNMSFLYRTAAGSATPAGSVVPLFYFLSIGRWY